MLPLSIRLTVMRSSSCGPASHLPTPSRFSLQSVWVNIEHSVSLSWQRWHGPIPAGCHAYPLHFQQVQLRNVGAGLSPAFPEARLHLWPSPKAFCNHANDFCSQGCRTHTDSPLFGSEMVHRTYPLLVAEIYQIGTSPEEQVLRRKVRRVRR